MTDSTSPPSATVGGERAPTLSGKARAAVLCLAFAGLLFDGLEMGLMPVASLSVSKSLLGAAYTDTLGGEWFARFTAALMLGAAIGGIALGALGDRIGRARAFGVCALFYSVFAGLGAFVQTQEQMLGLRFLVGLGAGGMWPNAVALVAECWPNASRPLVCGVTGAGINCGYLLLSLVALQWHVTPDDWRWLFRWAAIPAILGVVALKWLPESPSWLAQRNPRSARGASPARTIRRSPPAWCAAARDEKVRAAGSPVLTTRCLLALFNNFTGWSGIYNYLPMIFKQGGFPETTSAIFQYLLAYSFMGVMTLLACFAVDRVGRRPLWLAGSC